MKSTANNGQKALCVDCDGALLKINIFHEAILLFVKTNSRNLFLLPELLLRGRTRSMEKFSHEVRINWRTVPVNQAVVDDMRAARAVGRQIFLLTSMPLIWATELCAELEFPQAVIVDSSTRGNQSVAPRLAGIAAEEEFDYIGGGTRDLPHGQSVQ